MYTSMYTSIVLIISYRYVKQKRLESVAVDPVSAGVYTTLATAQRSRYYCFRITQ